MNKSLSPSMDIAKRNRREQWFRWRCRAALWLALFILAGLLVTIIARAIPALTHVEMKVPVSFENITGDGQLNSIAAFTVLSYNALYASFPEVQKTSERKQLAGLISNSTGPWLKRQWETHPQWHGKTVDIWLPVSSATARAVKQQQLAAHLTDAQQAWVQSLLEENRLRSYFNTRFFTSADSRHPEQAGFLGAMVGSLLTLLVCMAIAFPFGVATAVYMEEFSRKGKWVDIIEVNINNLAAVPSIIYGLLGLAIFLNLFHMPRSSALVGGMTLSLMTLPVIIIATRAALQAVPNTIRDAARGLGATNWQMVWHHTLPLSIPGIMTGTILGLARALGETAPLLMIGMVAFIADVPDSFGAPATVMPVQIFLWASSPETGFVEKTAAGILVLLVLLLAMNALAIYIRNRFKVKW